MYTYISMPFKSAARVRRGGETGIITKKNFNCNHFEVTDVAIREHCNVVKCVKGNIPFT